MNKPRFAIEIAKLNDNNWELYLTRYFNIEDTEDILIFVKSYSNKKTFKINRFYYANNYGVEIDYAER